MPWLTSGAVLDRLAALPACCIVIDKGANTTAAAQLLAADNGLPNVLPRLADLAPAIDGEPVVLGPTDSMPRHKIGPLRIAGWRLRSGTQGPLLHAKILVLGVLAWEEDDLGQEDQFFFGRSVWWGSANWTKATAQHLEIGFWADDRALVSHAREFVSSVIAFSEPRGSPPAGPEPNLIPVEYDDEAILDYLAEYGGPDMEPE